MKFYIAWNGTKFTNKIVEDDVTYIWSLFFYSTLWFSPFTLIHWSHCYSTYYHGNVTWICLKLILLLHLLSHRAPFCTTSENTTTFRDKITGNGETIQDESLCGRHHHCLLFFISIVSVERQKALATHDLHRQLDPFASRLTNLVNTWISIYI